jgi:hypothetical protein
VGIRSRVTEVIRECVEVILDQTVLCPFGGTV